MHTRAHRVTGTNKIRVHTLGSPYINDNHRVGNLRDLGKLEKFGCARESFESESAAYCDEMHGGSTVEEEVFEGKNSYFPLKTFRMEYIFVLLGQPRKLKNLKKQRLKGLRKPRKKMLFG